jgi:membrane peptidoglycan carboxypeptidase
VAEQLFEGTFPPNRPDRSAPRRLRRASVHFIPALRWGLRLVTLLLIGWGAVLEMRTSFLQAFVVSRLARDMTFTVAPGPSQDIHFPTGGPHDERLGYAKLPSFIEALSTRHFVVEHQAVPSPRLDQLGAADGYAIYHEKGRAGLAVLDRAGAPLYAASYPERTYGDFTAIPPLVVDTLLFIEDRYLLDPRYPQRNPAVDWKRFLFATAGRGVGWFYPPLRQGGASTLATQIEKFRHSPGGRTGSIEEKLRQMMAATMRAYLDGPDTTRARQRIVATFLDSTPLSSRPGYGEIIGVGDGLFVWYGTDFAEANRVLAEPAAGNLARKAEIYKQMLSLLLAERRPTYYLTGDRRALDALTDRSLHLLAAAGIIDPALRDAALRTELHFRAEAPAPAAVSFVGRKAADAIRTGLLSLLHTPTLYDLDRLDLTATTTLDAAAQQRVTDVLTRLGDPVRIKSLGLVGPKLLGTADPARVTYSMVLYERGADRNSVRIHADSLDQPFDINSGAKLILGSTAKLRTLITYLNVMAALHGRYGEMPSRELLAVAALGQDPLTRWAATYLAGAADRNLQAMLDAAMQRRYSASPGERFFTGGGMHVFHNYERSDDGKVPTVKEAIEHSINLVFVRLMRDIVHYYTSERGALAKELQSDEQAARREAYLRRFADEEGRKYLDRFYDDHRGGTPDETLARLATHTKPVPRRLAVVFRSVRPQASVAELRDFLAAHVPKSSFDDAAVEGLYAAYAADRYSLADRGYLAGVHPLELWLATYLQTHPGASRGEVLRASTAERQEVYAWLFKTRSAHKQDVRLRILMEEDAFDQILQDWRRQGYPFGHLIPSLATAIGSSGDRPDALARLMGIILNDGIMLQIVDTERLHFAADTPYETDVTISPAAPKRVLAPEVAATVRRALMGVVAQGTGARLRNAYRAPDGIPLAVGGKTGTGDNRFESFGAGGRLIGSRVVDRTATFVFFLGDRFFGTITAYVPGDEAADYHFTSALCVQLLKALAPQLRPLIDTPAAAGGTGSGARARAIEELPSSSLARAIVAATN